MAIPKDEIKQIYINEYSKGESTIKLGEKYNIAPSYFSKWFKKLGFLMRTNEINSKKYTYNENYFKNIDTQDKAYWLGFIYADGYITTKKNQGNRSLGISLCNKDIDHLYKFRNCIDGDIQIKEYDSTSGYKKGSKYCRILVKGKTITNHLISHGVVERKSNILQPPNIEQSLIRHFIRGYLDGNGSIWSQTNKKGLNRQYNIGVVGAPDVIFFIQQYLYDEKILHRTYPMTSRKDGQIVKQIKFGGNKVIKKVLEYLYEDANIYLERKYKIYLEFKEFIKSRSY